MLRLIQKWLKAGVSEDGGWSETKQGTPQGAVASPLLANVYLHYLFDLWADVWRKKVAKGDVVVVRYADDLVVGFQDRTEAERFLKEFGEDRMKKDMRIAALPAALLSIVVGIAGIASPDGVMMLRRLYFATPALFYVVVAVRSAMGLGLILAASSSRWPRILRALGAVVCLQGISATLLGLDHARAIMEWEGMQGSALLRAGAAVALASGGFVVFAVTQRPSEEQGKTAH